MAENLKWTGWHTLGLLGIIVVIALVGWFLIPIKMLTSWLIILILLFIFCAVAGQGVTGLWRGLLIDERKKMSLSRLQLLLWTVIILSAYLTAVLFNIINKTPNPLAVAIQEELWWAMGISTVSLVGTPLIRSDKKRKKEDKTEFDRMKKSLKNEGFAKTTNIGQIVYNESLGDSSWSDLFKGEEVGNAAFLDLGKVQMFFFTLIVVGVYATLLGTMFGDAEVAQPIRPIQSLPPLDSSMLVLLAISHGGYLVNKTVPHSKTG